MKPVNHPAENIGFGTDPHQPFSVFLQNFRDKLDSVFHQRTNSDLLGTQRGLPPYVIREILAAGPFLAFIPAAYGGRGGHVHEGIDVISTASYESLALGLTLGINWALFLQPVAKYANEEIKSSIFKGFVEDKKMGGLMITEPNHGSDALNMRSQFREVSCCRSYAGIRPASVSAGRRQRLQTQSHRGARNCR